jgi:LAS superfamily LD-carboxypeptidase LdcB
MPRVPTRPRALALLALFVATLGIAACQPTPQAVVTPTTAKATCTTTSTRSIVVAESIVNSTRRLLAAAKADGLLLCGGGYRSPEAQIAVRKANCGTTYYDIYEKPASECTPPTAKPGTSMHEKGLAIDFENCSTRTTKCYTWLAKHAATYGFKNLPSEPWHWSTTGG